jgi:hypothetical protein
MQGQRLSTFREGKEVAGGQEKSKSASSECSAPVAADIPYPPTRVPADLSIVSDGRLRIDIPSERIH